MQNVTIYGTPVCPNCKNVTSFLSSSGVQYNYKTVGNDIEQNELERIVSRPVRSVPVIVADGRELSFDELKVKVKSTESLSVVSDLQL